MEIQPVIDWLNTWPVDTMVLEWVAPRIIILGTIVYILKIVAKLTPWTWDNVIVAAIDSVLGRVSRRPKNDRPADQPDNPL